MLFNLVKRTSLLVPALVMLIGLLGTAGISTIVWRIIDAKDAERFEHSVDLARDAIHDRLDAYITLLQSGAAFFAASDNVTYKEFAAFVERQRIPQRFPGIQGIGLTLKLKSGDQAWIVPELQSRGIQDFRVWPENTEVEAHSIIYLEPLNESNLRAIGFNMFSEATRREAMRRAYETGEAAASGKVHLVQESGTNEQTGFLIFVPVYATDDGRILATGRGKNLFGYVYAPFRTGDLLNGIFGGKARPNLSFRIYDGPARPENLLYASAQNSNFSLEDEHFSQTQELNVAGRTWTIQYATLPAFEQSSTRLLVPFILATGLLMTVVMTGFSWAQVKARRSAERADEEAQRYAHELETLNKAGVQLAAQLDPDHLLLALTQAGQNLVGAEYAAFIPFAANLKSKEAVFPDWLQCMASPEWPGYNELRPAFEGRYIVSIDDVSERFQGSVPVAAHIRSLMLVPVVSRSAEVLGVLVFAHSQPNTFTQRTESVVAGIIAQAAIALDNALLYRSAQNEIEERARGQRHLKLLLDELNHRVKNTLATVQSIALMTIRNSDDFRTFRNAFDSRLMALSHTHNLLTRSKWEGASLREILLRELDAYQDTQAQRFMLDGEDILLLPNVVVSLGMVIHELATNAAKYGALSVPGGHVHVAWGLHRKDGLPSVHLVWQESGGPLVEKPRRRGFGTKLIERGLNQDLGGGVRFEFAPAGVCCSLDIPLMAYAEAA